MQKRSLLTIFVIVFVDLLGFGLILPLLPFYAETFGASATLIGLLVASYAAAQFIGAPILGRLSDRFGRRPILLVSLGGTFAGFLMLGFAPAAGQSLAAMIRPEAGTAFASGITLAILFASRILDGLTGGNISVAQAYITDVTDASNRARGLGLIGAAFGLGFIIGPALGGTLSVWGFAVPAFAAAGLSFVNLILLFAWLPESLTPERRAVLEAQARPPFTLGAMLGALRRPRVGPLLHIRVFFGLASSMFQTIFALYAQSRLGLTAQSTGYVLTYVGVLAVLVQGVGVGWLTARYAERWIIFVSTAVMAASLLAWAFVPSVGVLLVVLAPLAAATGTLNTLINSALTKVVYPEEVGGTLGLSASLESLTRVVSPSLGGVLLQQVGAWAPGVFSALTMAWVVSFAWRRLIARPDAPLPPRVGEAAARPAAA
jgi:DHA1 family tetracycline resistance protein-like MFS transporter